MIIHAIFQVGSQVEFENIDGEKQVETIERVHAMVTAHSKSIVYHLTNGFVVDERKILRELSEDFAPMT